MLIAIASTIVGIIGTLYCQDLKARADLKRLKAKRAKVDSMVVVVESTLGTLQAETRTLLNQAINRELS